VDGRADVYAVGVCLYEATTGQRPFVGMTEGELFAARVEGVFRPPSKIIDGYSGELEQIVLRAMADEPSVRPTAAELEDELRGFAAAHGANAQEVTGWLSGTFPDQYSPPLRRVSSKLAAAPEPNPTKMSFATGSRTVPVSNMLQDAAAPPSPAVQRSRPRWPFALAVAIPVGAAVIYVALRTEPARPAAPAPAATVAIAAPPVPASAQERAAPVRSDVASEPAPPEPTRKETAPGTASPKEVRAETPRRDPARDPREHKKTAKQAGHQERCAL
jgi:serine/threonine-protein kinase